MGKAKGYKEGSTSPEEPRRSQADECGHAQEVVGNDEGTVGG
jgi:hypothetical protein